MTRPKLKHKSKEQKSSMKKCKKSFTKDRKNIKLFDDCTTITSQAKYKARHGKGLKILIPKQMLQRLPMALAQVRADNTSADFLDAIRQIIYSFYRANEIIRKGYNNNEFNKVIKEKEYYIYEF